MALVIERYRPSPGEMTGLLLLTGGVVVSVWYSLHSLFTPHITPPPPPPPHQ